MADVGCLQNIFDVALMVGHPAGDKNNRRCLGVHSLAFHQIHVFHFLENLACLLHSQRRYFKPSAEVFNSLNSGLDDFVLGG